MAPTKKKRGFLDTLVEGANNLIMENPTPRAEPVADAPAAPPPAPKWAPSVFIPGPAPASATLPIPSPAGGQRLDCSILAAQPAQPDPEALKTIQDNVYTSFGDRQSKYLPFLQMHEQLGRPADIGMVISALQITDKSYTAEAIAADAKAHVGLLDSFVGTVQAEFAQEYEARVGNRGREIERLTALNQTAAEEIVRHQQETNERNTQIQAINQEAGEENAKLERGKQVMSHAEQHVRASLNSALALFKPKEL